MKDGRLMALGRNNSIRDKEGRVRMPMSVSDDMGKTWHYSASEFPPIDEMCIRDRYSTCDQRRQS